MIFRSKSYLCRIEYGWTGHPRQIFQVRSEAIRHYIYNDGLQAWYDKNGKVIRTARSVKRL